MNEQSLYRVLIKSLEHTDGVERLMCRQCADHARWISESQGPRWYIRGEAFRYLDTGEVGGFTNFPLPHHEGECPDCESRRRSEARIVANIEGVPYSRTLDSIR